MVVLKNLLFSIVSVSFCRTCFLGVQTLLFAVITNYSFGQACCSGGVPLGGTLGLGTADYKTFQFLLTYDRNVLNDLMSNSTLLKDDTRSRLTNSTLLEVNYGINKRWAVAAVLPFVRQERIIKGFEGKEDFTFTQGLGDVMLLLKYRILNPETTPFMEWVVGGGPKLPTGQTDFLNNDGLTLPADMQPGSGSLDGMFWTFFQKSKFPIKPMSLVMVSTFRKSGKNNGYNGNQVYQFGDEFQANLGINYNFFAKWPIDIFAFGRYRSQTVDLIDGNVFPGSGGKWVYVIPGFNVSFIPDLSFRASADLPVYRNLSGTQLTTSYRYTLAVFYNFNPHKKKNNNTIKFGEL
jgi:hypothetical protein